MSDYDNEGGTAGRFGYGLDEVKPIRRYVPAAAPAKTFHIDDTDVIDKPSAIPLVPE